MAAGPFAVGSGEQTRVPSQARLCLLYVFLYETGRVLFCRSFRHPRCFEDFRARITGRELIPLSNAGFDVRELRSGKRAGHRLAHLEVAKSGAPDRCADAASACRYALLGPG